MPRIYKRITNRASWSEDNLKEAVEMVNAYRTTAWQASKEYNIPCRTLRRRIAQNNTIKGSLGLASCLNSHETNLIRYIKKMESAGYPLTSVVLRRLAYSFAEINNIPNKFNKEKKMAGYDWLQLFLKRYPELSIRKAEGVSIARALGMCKERVGDYFQLLKDVMTTYNLINTPGKIYNVDETGLQLNNNPGKIIATKGSRTVYQITSSEKG